MRKDERGSGGDDGFCMIDPVILGGVINDLATMEAAITAEMKGLKAEFEKVGVSTGPINDLVNVSHWLHDELPMLRRRHAAALMLESQGMTFYSGTRMLAMPEDPDAATQQAAALAVKRVREGLDGQAPGRDGIADAVRAIQRIRNNKGALSPDDLLFLETFYRDLGKDVYRVPAYLKKDENWADTAVVNSKARTDMTAAIVGGLLTLSDEGRGGGWSRLPKFVQAAAADRYKVGRLHDGDMLLSGGKARELADFLTNSDGQSSGGVVLSKVLAITAAQSADEYKRLSSGMHPVEDDSVGRIFLQVAARNERAMHDLLTNQQMGPDSNPTGHLFDGYGDPKKFMLSISTHAWSDDGKAASSVTDWIADASRSSDPQRKALGREAMQGLVTTMADPSVVSDLMDIDGWKTLPDSDHDALGDINPVLARSLARDTAAFLPEFSDQEIAFFKGTDTTGEKMAARWFTLVSTDPTAAEALAGAVYREKADGIHDQLNHPTDVVDIARRSGQLQGLLDVGLDNAALERTGDKTEAKQQADALRGKVLGVLGQYLSKAGSIPGLDPVQTADDILGRVLSPNTDPVEPQQIKTYGVDPRANGGAWLLARYEMTSALVESGQIKVEDLPDLIRNDGNPPRLKSPAEFRSTNYTRIQGEYERATAGVPGMADLQKAYLGDYSNSYGYMTDNYAPETTQGLQTKLGIG
jgi:hypothetical protein